MKKGKYNSYFIDTTSKIWNVLKAKEIEDKEFSGIPSRKPSKILKIIVEEQ
jgi:hypothetical protein